MDGTQSGRLKIAEDPNAPIFGITPASHLRNSKLDKFKERDANSLQHSLPIRRT